MLNLVSLAITIKFLAPYNFYWIDDWIYDREITRSANNQKTNFVNNMILPLCMNMKRFRQVVCCHAAADQKDYCQIRRDFSYAAYTLKPSTTPHAPNPLSPRHRASANRPLGTGMLQPSLPRR